MGKSSKSRPPDVVGAAETEGEFSRETARDVTYADRPDQFNPLGSIQWSQQRVLDPASGEYVTQWTQNQRLNPQAQGIFSRELGNVNQTNLFRQQALNRAAGDFAQGPDFDQFGNPVAFNQPEAFNADPNAFRQQAEDAAYQRETSRLDPQFQQRESDIQIQLRNQGLRPGDEAYDRAIGNFNRDRADAYEQARFQATGIGRQEAAQSFGQAADRSNIRFGQETEANRIANALRQQGRGEYLQERGFNFEEAERLGEGQGLRDLTTIAGGG